MPQLVANKQSRVEGLVQKIWSLLPKISLLDIKIQLHVLYGSEVSESLISKIPDNGVEKYAYDNQDRLNLFTWLSFFDWIVLKVKYDKRIINKAIQ